MKNYWLDRVNEVVWMAHMENVNKWYVIKKTIGHNLLYLHRDGVWRFFVLSRYNKNFLYDTREEAEAILAKVKYEKLLVR
jgi:hypothetical protein